jgi:ABC-type branched-subunit amino acid transport system substrate-binding protein
MASVPLHPQGNTASDRGFALAMVKLLLLALMAAIVAGCVPRSRPAPTPPPAPVEEVVPERPTRLPPDETRNRVAVLVPLTGANASLGQSILNAANLALLDTGGQRIRITAYDTNRAGGAAAAANEAIADGNGLFLGPLLAEDVRTVAPIARQESVPVIAFSNDVSVAGNGVYVIGFNPGQSIERVVGYARSRGVQRFGALVPANNYGERSSEALTAALQGAGGTLSGVQTYDRSATGLRAAATRLNAQGRHDGVLIADGAQIALQAAPLVRQATPQPRLFGTELWAADGNLGANVALRGAWYAAPADANFAAFRTRYRARYTAAPFRLASLGYDAVLLSVRIAANWPVGRRFPAPALRDSTGFVGVDGAFRFGRDGVAERALEVREVTATGTTVVSPAPRGFN